MVFSLRRAARAASHRLDIALAPIGLSAGQFTILSALAATAESPSLGAARLCRTLAMDRSTLNRNLAPLLSRGLIARDGGRGRTGLRYRLTGDGADLLQTAGMAWQTVQRDLIGGIGGAEAGRVLAALDRITSVAQK
ncbi:MAG: MarR family winged helix-turn-helix transcriptional regulator [Rhodospirillaceae bacterium]|nr:MarR family winged helix-turn-helix transcriptional regulator [Rhodospirillaceae bacterium]